MINYPDWDKAPEGATHFHFGNMRYSPHWYKQGYFCVTDYEGEGWKKDSYPIHISEYLERPKTKPKPKQWSGPQDGLPPIGIMCECQVKANSLWVACEIVAHKGQFAIGYVDANTVMLSGGTRFRAIKTPEQLAAEQRETAIRDFMDLVGIDCRVTASKAIDAGFKREVV